MRDAALDKDASPHSHGRLSDWVLITFRFACDQGDLEVADRLIATLDHMLHRAPLEGRPKRRISTQALVATHERLWALRHPGARND